MWTCPAELPGTFPGASPALGSPRTRGSFDSGPLDRGQGVSQGGHGPSPTPPRWRPGRSPRRGSGHAHPTGCEPPEHRCVFTHAPGSVGGSTCSADAPRDPDTRPGAGPQVCCLPLGIVLRGGRPPCTVTRDRRVRPPAWARVTVWPGYPWPHSRKAAAASPFPVLTEPLPRSGLRPGGHPPAHGSHPPAHPPNLPAT